MNNNPFHSQPTHTPQGAQRPPLPPRQPPAQPAQPDYSALWDIGQHPPQSHVQAPPAPVYNPQWQRPQLQYQQHQYHALPPVAQPPPHPRHPAVQPGYNPYQSTAGYYQHHGPHAVASSQPQLPYYPHLQPQQQPQFQLPLPLAQNTGVYTGLNQGSGHGDGSRGLNNAQLSASKEAPVENHGWMSGGRRGARGGSLWRNKGGMAGRGLGGGHMGSNGEDGRGGQSDGSIHAHGSGGNFLGATSMQAGGRNQFPIIAEPATVPITTQFQDAHGFNIWGNPQFRNVGVDHSVNFYGGTHGLEKLENFVSFAALHDSFAQDPHRRCHPGTRENVLSRIRHWIDNPNATDHSLALWSRWSRKVSDCTDGCHASCLPEGEKAPFQSAVLQSNAILHGYNQGEVAATFFFFRSDSGRNDGNRLFPTIAWQLAFSIPATKEFIVHAIDKTPHLPTKGVETQFEQLVAHLFERTNNIASQMPHPASVVIIDGLDECSDEQLQQRILAVIGNAIKDCRVPLRFLILSRPEALIEETLNQFQEFSLRFDLATLDDSDRDVEKYLVDEFSVIASKQRLAPTWPSQEIIEDIVFKSSGNFNLASTLIRFIGDEDYSAESQLDIVRKLKPHGTMSPFALLDELYLEILKRQRDQDFLKTFLALLVGRNSIRLDHMYPRPNLHEDDATLMNVSEKELHIKLRRMRSLLRFEPFIDVYHKSFLDFLQDSSRSGQYHVSKQDGLKWYSELIVNSVVRHVSMAVEEPNHHGACHSSPAFKDIVEEYPPNIVLPAEDWKEALKPLLVLQDKLLKTSKPQPCRITQAMRDLLLHLMILQRSSHDIAAPAPESNNNETVTEWSPALVIEPMQNIPENDLDRCLSALLSCLQKPYSVLAVDTVIIERMSSLLAFDRAETAARVRSVTDAQKLIDIVDLLTNNESFLSQCGQDAACFACLLASEVFARVPVLPQSLFLDGPTQQCAWFQEFSIFSLEYMCSSAIINRILGHTYTLPTWLIYQRDKLKFVDGNVNDPNESVYKWLERARPNFVTRIRVMLEIARTIRYVHSMKVVTALGSTVIHSRYFALDSDLRARIMFRGAFAWQIREKLILSSKRVAADFTYESNISAFAHLFYEVCFRRHKKNRPNHLVEDATQLIKRCRAEDPKSRPTMEDVVKEMETWDLT